jgi:hypothetical protein
MSNQIYLPHSKSLFSTPSHSFVVVVVLRRKSGERSSIVGSYPGLFLIKPAVVVEAGEEGTNDAHQHTIFLHAHRHLPTRTRTTSLSPAVCVSSSAFATPAPILKALL